MADSVSNTLKEFVEKSGVSLAYIARNTGINRTMISYYLHNRYEASPVHKRKINEFIETYGERWVNDVVQ